MSHSAHREYIANHMITTSLATATRTQQVNADGHEGRLSREYFQKRFAGDIVARSKLNILPNAIKFAIL